MSEYLTSPTALNANPVIAYGAQAARYLFARTRALAPGKRSAVIGAVLDAIDPALRPAAARASAAMVRAGVPASQAAERGLAAVMSKGVMGELSQLGRSKRTPSPKSLLGLGVWGTAGLGEVLEDLGATTTFSPILATAITKPPATTTPIVRDQRGTDPTGTHGGQSPPTTSAKIQVVQVGPFTFAPGGGHIIWHKAAPVPESWRAWFATELAKLSGKFPERTIASDLGLDLTLGMAPGTKVAPNLFDGRSPAFRVKNPVNGATMGIYFVAAAGTLGVEYKPIPAPSFWSSLMQKIISGLLWLPAKLLEVAKDVYDAAKDAAGYLADQACKLVNHPMTQAAVTGGAAAVPGAGTAAAVGVALAQQMCAGQAEPQLPLPVPPPPGSGWLLPALGIGAVVLVIAARR